MARSQKGRRRAKTCEGMMKGRMVVGGRTSGSREQDGEKPEISKNLLGGKTTRSLEGGERKQQEIGRNQERREVAGGRITKTG